MRRFEEAFTSENWIVRIYRVKPRENRESVIIRPKQLKAIDSEEEIRRTSSSFVNHKYARKVVPEKKKN